MIGIIFIYLSSNISPRSLSMLKSIKTLSLDKGGSSENDAPSSKKKKGPRRSKKGNLIIDETHIIQPDEIPKGSRFKGYQERVI
jgi:hypothetical protein